MIYKIELSINLIVFYDLFLLAFLFIGGFISYFFEYYKRKNFYFKRSLEKRHIELREKNIELKELNNTKSKFFSIISHDLRNPFNILYGFSQILVDEKDSIENNNLKIAIESIYKTSRSTYELLENLLLWAKTQLNGVKLSPSVISVKTSVLSVLSVVTPMALKKNIEIKLEIDDIHQLFIDNNIFTTVVRNLLTNSIKYSYENSNIKIKSYVDDQYLYVSIKDSGIGISESELKKIFRIDSFESKSGTNGEKGTGLGLVLCKEYLALCNGEISAESELGKGSNFILKFDKYE